mgnify:CR=1 FL=1
MENYIIREAEIADLKRIQELSQEFIEHEEKLVNTEYMIPLDWALSNAGYENYKKNIENDFLFVVCIEEKIIGYMTCWINKQQDWDKHKTVEIGNIYIQEEYRNKGIGTKLIEKAKNICKQNNIKFLEVKVLYDNELAKKFYEKNNLNKYMITQITEV